MSTPAIFENSEFALQLLTADEPGFCVLAPGLARALGFREAHDLLRSIPEDEKGSELVRTPGGDQRVGYLTEAGFYRALGQRQSARIVDDEIRAAVERFQRWVYADVLPAIRRTGSYRTSPALPEMPSHSAALRGWAAEIEAREFAEAKVAELEPAADAWTALADAAGDYSLREAAEVLCRDERITTGQNRLMKYLREIGWLDRRGKPYQSQIDLGRIAVRTRTYDDPYTGEPTLTTQIRVTSKGVDALHKLMTAPVPGLSLVPGEAS